MKGLSAAALAALFLLVARVQAADVSGAVWKYDNPFCSVIGRMDPLHDGSGYSLVLYAARGASLDAHVTLVSRTDAYDASVTRAELSGPPTDLEAAPAIVTLARNQRIEYFFVDSFALDGGRVVTCPSYVFAVGNDPLDSVEGAPTVPARHVQSLDQTACGRMYQEAEEPPDIGGLIGRYGNKPLSVELRAYLDSKGHAIEVKTLKSSGVDGVDQTMVGIVQQAQFVPARFLCTPVVSELLVRADYAP